MTLGFVKILYAAVCFFNEAIISKVRATTETVETVAREIGKCIIVIINASTKRGGTFASRFSIDGIF